MIAKFHRQGKESVQLYWDNPLGINTQIYEIPSMNYNEIIRKLSIKQSLNSLIGFIMHMACMLDRLKEDEHEFKFNDIELYLAQYGHEIELIRDSVLRFEGITDAKISDDELCMIHRFYRF